MENITPDKFGINMKRFCRTHESRIQQAIKTAGVSQKLLDFHLEKLRWLQHERLVHLVVLVMTVFAELFMVYLMLIYPETNPAAAIIVLVFAALLGFYFVHYFFLENTTQHWYHIAELMMEELAVSERKDCYDMEDSTEQS